MIQFRNEKFYFSWEIVELFYNLPDKNVRIVARRLGISETAVSNRLKGVTPVTLREFEIICHVFGVMPGDVIRLDTIIRYPIDLIGEVS